MNDPEIWTVIGVFAAAMLGGLTLVVTSLSRVIRAEVGGLRAELRAELSGVNSRLDATNTRLEHLDRDVQALTRRVWGAESDS
ncbi:hypothetical protein [Humibacter sp.]|jgi:hypothetical protein|uniref:hypothetical protein n=1 Tax=Humibacter sp. TaxID=1940291 RepID=UPI003F7F892B